MAAEFQGIVVPPGLALRRARAGDESAMCATHERAIRISAASHYSEDEIDAWADGATPDGYRARLLTCRTVVAEAAAPGGPRIVGFGMMHPDEGVIEALYVDPDHGRRGIGAAIANALEADARALGLLGIVVDASLNSVPFYRALGYRQEALDRHEPAPGVHLACAVMDKRFAAHTGGR